MRVLIALDLNDDDLAEAFIRDGGVVDKDDVREALEARLGRAGEACYCGPYDSPVRGDVLAVADVTRTLDLLLDAAEVGAEGMEGAGVADTETADEVWQTVRTMSAEVSANREG